MSHENSLLCRPCSVAMDLGQADAMNVCHSDNAGHTNSHGGLTELQSDVIFPRIAKEAGTLEAESCMRKLMYWDSKIEDSIGAMHTIAVTLMTS